VLITITLSVSNVKRADFRRVTHSLSGVSYHFAAVLRVNNVNLCTIKPQL